MKNKQFIGLLMSLLLISQSVFGQTIESIEYFIDTDPGFGQATQVDPGKFTLGDDISTEFNIDLSGLKEGIHQLYVRAKNSDDVWSMAFHKPFYVHTSKMDSPTDLDYLEYFLDTDPGYGMGRSISVSSPDENLSFKVDLSGLTIGMHQLFIRGKDSRQKWSLLHQKSFMVSGSGTKNIVEIHYYFMKDGKKSQVFATPVTPSPVIDVSFLANIQNLLVSTSYTMHLYAIDSYGNKSHEFRHEFSVSDPVLIDSSWVALTIPATFSFHALASRGNSSIIVGENGNALINEYFGGEWSELQVAENCIYDVAIDSIFTVSTEGVGLGTAIAVGENGLIRRSTDGASTWESISSGTANTLYTIAGVFSGNTGSVVSGGDGGQVLISHDAGQNWQNKTTGTDRSLNDVKLSLDFTSGSGTGIAVGDEGVIIRSTDGGDSWQVIQSGKNYSLESLSYNHSTVLDSGIAVAVGSDGTLLRSNDHGENWSVIPLDISEKLLSVVFARDSIAYITGTFGLILKSNDWGRTWKTSAIKSASDLVDIAAFENGKVYVIGSDGSLFQNGEDDKPLSIVEEHNITPEHYHLSQNYPNPFNPKTSISFEISQTKNMVDVKLLVYDILGRIVGTLVNETKKPGRYTVKYDASHLSSGLYFYQLKAGDFVSTRKMLLVK
jgi:photosystem II stability/assembly factor-like uncharacterized protein